MKEDHRLPQNIGSPKTTDRTEVMVNNRIPHDSPELREVLMGFLDSASGLCDMMNTTMAAVLCFVN